MLLYDNAISGNCYKVRLLLFQLGLPFERRELSVTDRSNRPKVLGGMNPSLRVPTIVLDDGRPLGESNAILWYFGDGTRFVPEERYERAQFLQASRSRSRPARSTRSRSSSRRSTTPRSRPCGSPRKDGAS